MKLIRSYDREKVSDILRRDNPQKICLIFWHGLGDLVMFLPCLEQLRKVFPDIKIDIALQKGVGQEFLVPDALLIGNANQDIDGYDCTFQIHFPMAEHMHGLWTKAEWCCMQELGIDRVSYYPQLPKVQSKLVACHFQATALPKPINPDESTARQIWQEVIEAGFIPIESFFRHTYFNPVNKKFDFIDSNVRSIPASLEKLIGLLQSCFASICVASGNLPISLSIIPERTIYLEKEYPITCYTKDEVVSIDIKEYKKGSVKECLLKMAS